jgi:hypothetical protein
MRQRNSGFAEPTFVACVCMATAKQNYNPKALNDPKSSTPHRTMSKLRGRGVPLGEAESAPMGVMGAEEAGEYFGERMEAIERMVVSAWKVTMLSRLRGISPRGTARNKFYPCRGGGRGGALVTSAKIWSFLLNVLDIFLPRCFPVAMREWFHPG